MPFDVALVTDPRYTAATAAEDDWYLANILEEDRLLREALSGLGISSKRVAWSDPDVNWREFRLAVIRTTWDYFDRYAEFTAWLERVRHEVRLCNPYSTLRWNMDKHYLADLEARGVRIVRSRFIEVGCQVQLSELLDETGWHEAVLKPCVSGGARHTYRVSRENAAELQAVLDDLTRNESMLLQPFEPAIMTVGEDTLMMFAGRYTHAIRKRAKPGDFRVQDDHGGTVEPYEPTPAQIALAEAAIAACDPMPTYGRVDMVLDGDGRDAVMELELVEPELWLRCFPPAAEAFAAAIGAVMK
ncbi:ATP-grasp domain-containing protein [Aeoliella sp. SH292]|uniref:ATP-grasp domain-containing protein n=1 Tax=Aeoliella sp. SH292 TaxID=3454464 RepID=UPI003F9A2D82